MTKFRLDGYDFEIWNDGEKVRMKISAEEGPKIWPLVLIDLGTDEVLKLTGALLSEDFEKGLEDDA